MTSIVGDSSNKPVVINITPDQLQNRNKKAKITRDAFTAAIGFVNGYHKGRLILRSVRPFTPSAVDELVRSIEQSLIEIVGLTSFLDRCHIENKESEIVFLIQPGGRIYTVKYNLFLPTASQVRQVLSTDPLEKIAPLLNSGPLDNTSLQNYVREFQKDVKAPEGLRESDTVEFKKVKFDRNKNKSTADRILANKVTHYVAAFANHKGGHIYVGVDDKTYAVCGQTVGEEEKGEVLEKIESAITNMVWPDEHGKPERGKHWDIAFVSVLDEVNKEIPGLFVIIISVARCPGGVFLADPESYEVRDGKVMKMTFERWKKRILHDAYMRDIGKLCREIPGLFVIVISTACCLGGVFLAAALQSYVHMRDIACRENAWKEADMHKIPKDSKDTDLDEAKAGETSVQTTNVELKCESPTVVVPQQVKPSQTNRHSRCQRITNYMELLIHDRDFIKLQNFALKSLRIDNSDIKVTVGIMLSVAAYCIGNFSEAYKELLKVSSLITSTTNYMEFEIQRLWMLTLFLREEGKYNDSYEVAYGGLQQMESISPSWYTARMLNETGRLFTILANKERNEEVRQSLKQQACTLFVKAISHTSMIKMDTSHSVLKTILLRRCHLRLAMVYLGYSPLGDEASDLCVVSSDDVNAAIKSILAVQESSLKEVSLTNSNECWLYLVKSDVSYRKSQLCQDQRETFLKIARECVAYAKELASRAKMPAILTKYSESRLQRVSRLCC